MKKQKDSTSNFFSSKKRMKKAQAAMEFLMTYGWTLLVVLMAGAALVYFDVLNPSKFLPDNCNVQGFLCTDFQVTPTKISLYLTNNIGDDIQVTEVSVQTSNGSWVSNDNLTTNLQIGKAETFSVDINSTAEDRFKRALKIKYKTSTSGISHTSIGEITTTVEPS